MTPEMLFQVSGPVALSGWLALGFAPLRPALAQAVAGVAIPLVLALAYAGLVLAFWAGAEGGFGSLGDVERLFANPWLLLAGWLHYLCFDLLIGAWITRAAAKAGMPHWMVLPCLALTFLFGPAGFLLFHIIRAARARMKA